MQPSDPIPPMTVTIDEPDPRERIVCRRVSVFLDGDPSGQHINCCATNVPHQPVHHSPMGFEWGYGGSGPADLALSILSLYIPPGADGKEPVQCWRGVCSQTAWKLHQAFKRDWIAPMPRAGGDIQADDVRQWIIQASASLKSIGAVPGEAGE